MKKSLFFRQRKPLTVVILGISLLVLAVLILANDLAKLPRSITMFALGAILLGYSISYEIHHNYNHRKHFKLFGITVFKQQLNLIPPDYIVVFSTRTGKSSEWGPVSAMGNTNKGSSFVIRCFKGNQKFTVWRTNSIEKANRKAEELSHFLGVEIRS